MASVIVLTGKISAGRQWVTKNREEMVKAHAYDLREFRRGTSNGNLIESWSPPDDERLTLKAHAKGLQNGYGFRKRGNYVHPNVTVVQIDGVSIIGRLYFPAGLNEEFRFTASTRNRLEIRSKEHIRTKLGLSDNEEKVVEVVLELS